MKIVDTLTVSNIAKEILVAALHVKNDDLIKKGFAGISADVKNFVDNNSKEKE